MAYRVTVQINVETGEFEVFQIDDIATGGTGARHNAAHEAAAAELGGLIERRPLIEEVPLGGLDPSAAAIPRMEPEAEQTVRPARPKTQER
ncbi:hypothetical protein HNP84_004146 [Thermocatellispora tengchongensis]|uniref:FtsH ternary system domain-containing protein n=1 Tax=Thermocatellispora tengchongensis TaxID=1073253 RepID=A0A840NZR4_9ACTN|nr:hypothetical protein [Thermocatellispora tengchongensis]MBB5134414.1 hypothetical protein [Thermocatellispora tengchongensis]